MVTDAVPDPATDPAPDEAADPAADPRPDVGSEKEQLRGFLDGQREILLRKADGLDDAQLRQTLPPSSLTLAGLLNHAALNEDWWFTVRMAGEDEPEPWRSLDGTDDPDIEMTEALQLPGEVLRARYRDSIARSNAVLLGVADLDARAPKPNRDGGYFSNRWIVLHMIEETARHAGHADFLHESIDGATGE